MGTLSKLRRMVLRENVYVREAARRLRISRNTAAKWLNESQMVEPRYLRRQRQACWIRIVISWQAGSRPTVTVANVSVAAYGRTLSPSGPWALQAARIRSTALATTGGKSKPTHRTIPGSCP